MSIGNKRGNPTIDRILGGTAMALVIFIGVYAAIMSYQDGGWSAFPSKVPVAVDKGFAMVGGVANPLFVLLLNSDAGTPPETTFLKILVFIMISIIIIGALDSINIFGGTVGAGSKWTNFSIGIIVSIIGVRFMPNDLWASLTAPSSAFVAAILLGIPFGAMFFITMKIREDMMWLRKIMWVGFIVFLVYLLTVQAENNPAIIVINWVFIIASALLTFFDSQFIRWRRKEKIKRHMAVTISNSASVAMARKQKELREIQELIYNTPPKQHMTDYYKNLLEQQKDLMADIRDLQNEVEGDIHPVGT